MTRATRTIRVLIAVAYATAVAIGSANAQDNKTIVDVTVRPGLTPEERVADEIKTKELRKAAEEKIAGEESARIAASRPHALLNKARTFYIQSSTEFFEAVQMQNELRKREEFDRWQMAIIDSWEKRDVADAIIEVDRPLFTYTFTYKITDRGSGMIIATGKVTAFDGNLAAPQLAERVIEEIKKARGEASKKN
jgi:hypothetical protein